jgi:hypothetical protein
MGSYSLERNLRNRSEGGTSACAKCFIQKLKCRRLNRRHPLASERPRSLVLNWVEYALRNEGQPNVATRNKVGNEAGLVDACFSTSCRPARWTSLGCTKTNGSFHALRDLRGNDRSLWPPRMQLFLSILRQLFQKMHMWANSTFRELRTLRSVNKKSRTVS